MKINQKCLPDDLNSLKTKPFFYAGEKEEITNNLSRFFCLTSTGKRIMGGWKKENRDNRQKQSRIIVKIKQNINCFHGIPQF